MWLSLLWDYIVSFVDHSLNTKNYKAVIVMLLAIFLVSNLVSNRKITQLDAKLDCITAQFSKQDSIQKIEIYNHMDEMNTDAIDLFQGYANTNTEDLKTIIDKTTVSVDNSFLLKKLVEKSKSDILQEIKKIQFRNRYLRPDSLHIEVRKVTLNDTVKEPIYYAKRY